jgi:hypothetical protein
MAGVSITPLAGLPPAMGAPPGRIPASCEKSTNWLALKAMANAIKRAARAMRMRLFMVRFLSDTGERFDGITIAEVADWHITRTGYCTGYSSKGVSEAYIA